ncbi:MAG TPA: hypothetical protein VLS90_09020 [Thermodesulfobacteriota bacterium]|nr:hypothetical protein [Thermodesulfobacteriota bacterium]
MKNIHGDVIGTAVTVLENYLGHPDFVIVTLDENFGKRDIVVPFSGIVVGGDGSIGIPLHREVLARAPAFNRSQLNDLRALSRLYRHYGMAPPWTD